MNIGHMLLGVGTLVIHKEIAQSIGVRETLLLMHLVEVHEVYDGPFITPRTDIEKYTALVTKEQIEVEDNLITYNLLDVIPQEDCPEHGSMNAYVLNFNMIDKLLED